MKDAFYLSTLDVGGNMFADVPPYFASLLRFFLSFWRVVLSAGEQPIVAGLLGMLGIFFLLHETLDSMHQ